MTRSLTTENRSVLVDAVSWLAELLSGSLGIVIAILAVALVGFGMLQGRLPLRAGLRVVLGCFILFGAPAIARGLAGAALSSSTGLAQVPPPQISTPSEAPQYDPYAGATLPN